MGGTENDRPPFLLGQLFDTSKLSLIDDDLAVDALKDLYVCRCHSFERIGIKVSHNDTKRIGSFFANILVDLILVNVELQSVLVVR